MKVLFLGANGLDTSRLRIAAELRDVRAEIERAKERKQIEIRAELAIRPVDLSRVLLDEKPDVVHFSGHGVQLRVDTATLPRQTREFLSNTEESSDVAPKKSESALLFEGEEGISTAVSPEALAGLFGILKSQRCVVLNACFSSAQATSIAKHVDCVIGMKRAIDDQSALVFSAGFYQALSRGTSVREAFDLGTNLISICGFTDADVPELICKEGVDPQNVRLVHEPSTVVVAAQPFSRKTIARFLMAFVGITALAWGAHWAMPTTMPQLESGQGAIVVVMPRGPFDSARNLASSLCESLDRGAQGTEPRAICQSRGHFDHDASLREKASNAGASVLVVVDESRAARIYPLGKLVHHDLLAQHIPPVDLTRTGVFAALAPLIREWARVADGVSGGTLDTTRLRCGESVAKEPFGVALSMMLLRRLATNCPSLNEDVAALRPQCRQETCTLLDGIEVKPSSHPVDCDHETDARLRLGCFRKHAFAACREGKTAEVEQWSTLMDAQQNSFYAITASGVAACMASHSQALPSERRATLIARADKSEPACELPTCSAVSGQCGYCAAAIAERAGYWAQACDWVRAQRDYERAYQLSQDNEHLFGLVEARLHQFSTSTGQGLAQSTAEQLKKLTNATVEQTIRSALLAWIAAKRDGNRTFLDAAKKGVLEAYDSLPTGQFVYARESPDAVERGLLCARTAKECPVYDLFAVPKDTATKEALRDALQHAAMPVRGLCEDGP